MENLKKSNLLKQTDIRKFLEISYSDSSQQDSEENQSNSSSSQVQNISVESWKYKASSVIFVKNFSQVDLELKTITLDDLIDKENKILETISGIVNNSVISDPSKVAKQVKCLDQFKRTISQLEFKDYFLKAYQSHLNYNQIVISNEINFDEVKNKAYQAFEVFYQNHDNNNNKSVNQTILLDESQQLQQNSTRKLNQQIMNQNNQELLMKKLIDLNQNQRCSKKLLMRRFKLTRTQLDNALDQKIDKQALKQFKQQRQTSQNYQAIKFFIQKQLKEGVLIKSTKEISQKLKQKLGLVVSTTKLSKFMKQSMKMSFKKIYKIGQRTNCQQSIVARHFAAKDFIDQSSLAKTIINIDESSIQLTNDIKKSWSFKGVKYYSDLSQRLYQVNVLAGISNKGDVYFQLVKGNNNSKTFYYFLLELICILDKQNQHWRASTIFLLDNATYHKSQYIQRKFRLLQLSIYYLGPYHFEMAPIEKFFSFIKKSIEIDKDIENKDQLIQIYANLISSLNYDWVSLAFQHALTKSLKYLSFQKI